MTPSGIEATTFRLVELLTFLSKRQKYKRNWDDQWAVKEPASFDQWQKNYRPLSTTAPQSNDRRTAEVLPSYCPVILLIQYC